MDKVLNKTLLRIYDRLYKFYGPQKWWPADSPWEVIVGAILTQNTSWSNVEKAILNLKTAGALSSPDAIGRMTKKRLASLIRPAGYYNIKSGRLKNFTRFLSSRFSGSLEAMKLRDTDILREEMLKVNGIGHETCDSILLYACRKPVFVVDAYTRRVLSRHSLLAKDATYEAAQAFFTDNLPGDEKIFNEFHALIVRLAKDFCRVRADCKKCPLNNIKMACK